MQDYRKLLVWEKAHHLTLDIYKVVESFPKYEVFGLASQMRRSAYSIPTNIAEGAGRNSDADFAYFLNVALGSSNELDYQLLLSKELGYLQKEEYIKLYTAIGEIKGMLIALTNKVRTK